MKSKDHEANLSELQQTKHKKLEFSKFILSCCMWIYVLTVIYGMVYYAVLHNSEPMDLNGLFVFVGSPTGVAIGFYVWKSKCENLHKNPQITLQTARQAESDDLNYEEVLNDESSDMVSGDSCNYCSIDTDSVSNTKPETEMRRMVKVRRIRSGKTTRRGDRTA